MGGGQRGYTAFGTEHAKDAPVKDLKEFEVTQTYINGELVAENGKSNIQTKKSALINNFSCSKKIETELNAPITTHNSHLTTIIEALDGQLITNKLTVPLPIVNGQLTPDIPNDILKILIQNNIEIVGMTEILPSVNEIFIQAVNATS